MCIERMKEDLHLCIPEKIEVLHSEINEIFANETLDENHKQAAILALLKKEEGEWVQKAKMICTGLEKLTG